MVLREFYLTVAASDESATLCLREKGILQDRDSCEKCDSPMRLTNKYYNLGRTHSSQVGHY